jgi:hypothetical protein
MITMKAARAQFAGRVTVSEAEYEHDIETRARKVVRPRKRERRPLGKSFRAWARAELRGAMSPKLTRIVGGKP